MDDKRISETLMTLSEVAAYLKLAEKTVLRMAQKGEIPSVKIASQWRFMRPVIDNWLMKRMSAGQTDGMSNFLKTVSTIPISRLAGHNKILLDIPAGSKEEVLAHLIRPLACEKSITNEKAFLQKLLEREQMVSTAIGKNIALPHLRHPDPAIVVTPAVVIGMCREGVDFASIDGADTVLFFLISANDEIVHLRILSKINQLLNHNDVVSEFLRAKTEEEVLSTLIELEQQHIVLQQ
jgi:PTS system nitrogen regulatory IIA component